MLEQIKNNFKYAKEIEGEDYGYKGLNNEQIEWLITEVELMYKENEKLDRAFHKTFIREQKFERFVENLKELLQED